MTRKNVLHIKQILAWADEHFERTGEWPNRQSGRIAGTLDEKWANINTNLHQGLRGLRGGSSLARLLAEHRGKRNRKGLPRLTLKRVLGWVDAYRTAHGTWPTRAAGPIDGTPGETWMAVEVALAHGGRGLPRGSSLAKLLAQRRGVRHRALLGSLSREKILAWADLHRAKTGVWPSADSGPIADAPGETWSAVENALRSGRRGLRGGSTLARLLERHRGVQRGHKRQRPLTVDSILAWAKAHHRRHGRWPNRNSGAISEAPSDSWEKINTALRVGTRGLSAGSSLARFLAEHCGVRYHLGLPHYTTRQILSWADAYQRKHGKWPGRQAGAVDGAPGVNWSAVDVALAHGQRGLPGGSSLPRLLQEHRGVPNLRRRPPLSVRQILAWSDAHHQRTGLWPYTRSGPVVEAPGETWRGVDRALRRGLRGLGRRSSLAKLLLRRRGVGLHRRAPPLSVEQILRWAEASSPWPPT